MNSTITAKGQITIPKAAREHLGVKPGDRVRFFMDRKGSLSILALKPPTASRGMFVARRHVTIEEMNQAVRERFAARNRRTRSQ